MSGTRTQHRRQGERGTMLLVVLFIATAVAALAAISSGRVVAESRMQDALENGAQAYNDAMGQLQLAMSVVNASAYDNDNHNLELRASLAGDHGGTAAGDAPSTEEWLHDPDGVDYGLVRDTGVRVYRAQDYIRRLAKLKGETVPSDVDPDDLSDRYFVLEAQGRAGRTTRLVSALVRENQPFSSFVFFQNRHTLGVSGSPRGLIHSNDRIDFYFPEGHYVDSVSAVNGFGHKAGATVDNTFLADAKGDAKPISLDAIDFDKMSAEANLFHGQAGLDAEIRFHGDGRAEIREYTRPRHEMVERTYSETYVSGYEERLVEVTEQVQTGTVTEERTRQVVTGYETETYTVTESVQVGTTTETRTRQVPIYETQTLTGTRWVKVFVPYDSDGAGGGTAVGGDGDTVPGEYVWVQETYEYEGEVVVGYETETYTVEVPVYEDQEVTRTRDVPIYATETYTVEVPVYEDVTREELQSFPVYDTRTWSEWEEEFFPPQHVETTWVDTKSVPGTIFIDGRITRLQGEVNGRVTVVGNEKVRVTGSLRYVDDEGDTAMLNGENHSEAYERNPNYDGKSVLGVVAREDVLLTHVMPTDAEINATLMATNGRVGIAGFSISPEGEPIKDPYRYLTPEQKKLEEGYDKSTWSYRNYRFTKESLRRMGGIISNDRILETFIGQRWDGTTYVDEGFKRGRMTYDINLLFNPPPNFVEVPRPVLNYYAPIFFVRGEED